MVTSAQALPAIDKLTMRNGPKLNQLHRTMLYKPVTEEEITKVVASIGDDKPPGIDVANPSTVKEYRPIAYFSVLYKIISKVLAARLQKKAYDSVEWLFLEQVMEELGFPLYYHGKWGNTVPFSAAKCLRQGDPIFLFLFVISMEYLSRNLNGLK
ncbi:PREDICTED: uncharacterized protein LOC109210838 [Nicotiana attenuata]|uniref:uncharacterized protein LOC109210838 n=1 Tax=Nicotiana attenuata TaxID=49451 RepID=UPI000905AEDC|nr:PREDICTED: uncharacterized protein LOC109210838 [Nicotiana attenuata]